MTNNMYTQEQRAAIVNWLERGFSRSQVSRATGVAHQTIVNIYLMETRHTLGELKAQHEASLAKEARGLFGR